MMRLTEESELDWNIFFLNKYSNSFTEKIHLKLYRAVVRELIETEEEFGRDLLLVVEHYVKTVESAKCPKKVSDNKDVIFGNFKQIAEFHNT